MAHKYVTGEYLVLVFDRYGTKQRTDKAPNWQAAVSLGGELVELGGSFVVTRTVYNSLDGHSTYIENIEEEDNNDHG